MTQSLTDDQLDHLLNFVGYGPLNADIWFLGMEEAGGGEENLRNRLKFRKIEDCAEAHKILGLTHRHFGKRLIQRTWRGMCYIMLQLDGQKPTREAIRTYQAEELGSLQGNTLLTELMPIPKPKLSKWGYEQLIPQFASREEYYRTVKPRRVKYLRQLIAEHKPKVIVGYGKGFWPEYKQLFNANFVANGQFEVGYDGSTLVILTAHFTARAMNGKFEEIVSLVETHLNPDLAPTN